MGTVGTPCCQASKGLSLSDDAQLHNWLAHKNERSNYAVNCEINFSGLVYILRFS